MALDLSRDIIPIPGHFGEVSVKGLGPVLFHPNASRLLHVGQLGGTRIPFPGARHCRYEHALGVMGRTEVRAKRWQDSGAIKKEDVLPLMLAGFCHDIGHAALSHVLEDQLPTDHHENGREMLLEMERAFEAVDCDVKRVIAMLDGEDRLGTAVTDKNLGTDKLDYLERDAFHAGVPTLPLHFVEQHTLMTERGLAADRAAIGAAKLLTSLYAELYGGFYLQKSSLIIQRFLGKAFWYLTQEGEMTLEEPLRMTDEEFFGRMYGAKSRTVKAMAERWKAVRFPKTVVAFRYGDCVTMERVAGKPIRVFGLSDELMARASRLEHDETLAIEDFIAGKLMLSPHNVLLVKPPEPRRFEPKEVLLWDDGAYSRLSTESPDHYSSVRQSGRQFSVLRLCVPAEARAVAFAQAERIHRTIIERLGQPISHAPPSAATRAFTEPGDLGNPLPTPQPPSD